jgi:hypothetical protein
LSGQEHLHGAFALELEQHFSEGKVSLRLITLLYSKLLKRYGMFVRRIISRLASLWLRDKNTSISGNVPEGFLVKHATIGTVTYVGSAPSDVS